MKTGLEKIPLDNIDKLIDIQDVNWLGLALDLFQRLDDYHNCFDYEVCE